MTMAAPALERATDAGLMSGIDHLFHDCDPDWSLCGLDISDEPFIEGAVPNPCVVCADLEEHPCHRCGGVMEEVV